MRNEDEDLQNPEVDRDWLEGSLSELQQEGRVQQHIAAEQINQMLQIQAQIGYGSAFDLVSDYFPSLVTAYGREHLGGFVSDFDAPPDESDLGYGPLSSSEIHFDCDGVDQNAFRFYSNKDSEDNHLIHIIHKESGKKDRVSGKKLESLMSQSVACGLTLHYQFGLEKMQNILRAALDQRNEIDYWNYFYVQCSAPAPVSPKLFECPSKPQFNDPEPTPPTYLEYPPEPKPDSFSGSSFESAYLAWADNVKRIESENQLRYEKNVVAVKDWNSRRVENELVAAKWAERAEKVEIVNQKRNAEYLAAVAQWKKGQIKNRETVADLKRGYKLLKPDAVQIYFSLVLRFSVLPGDICRKCDLKYIPESKTLIIDHPLPNPENLVYIKEVEYVKASGKFFRKRLTLSDGEFKTFYDDLQYQICLRTLYEVFAADKGNALSAAVFNGWVDFVDKATGQDRNGCLLSIQATKEELQKLNLAKVEPKACFKALNGIANSTLYSLTLVEPASKSK
ncbi:MAG TPA: hypothetical protein VK327_10010 [Candidatus Paceibacterota bacterium]|nr:hypothetical protein [Candidatus Paceibacterota bacterium]